METTHDRQRGASSGWLRHYPKAWLRPDLVAGLTAAAVVLPKALAYATIAGLPVQLGLYTALVPMVIYALLGTSRPLSVSTTTTISILTAASLGLAVPDGDPTRLLAATATLSVLVGAVLLLAWALRLGFVANFISEPVLVGFKSGIGLVIIIDQIPKLLGVHIEKTGFFRDILATFGHLPETSVVTLVFAASTLALILALEHFTPKAPVPLIAVAAGIAASALLGLQQAGVELVGAVSRGLPTPIAPRLDLVQVLWPGAIGIALMSFTETIAAARAFSRPGEPRPIPNRELLAIGAANLGGGLLGAMPAGGGTSQTAVNRMAGARSQMAELVTAGTALATLLLLAPLLALMPKATLAAVVVAYSVGLISPGEFRAIRRVRRTEFVWALLALAGVALLGTLKGILVAVIVSLVSLAQQAYSPPMYPLGRKRGTQVFRAMTEEHPDDETWPGLLILRLEGRIFFANAQRAGDKMWQFIDESKPAVLLLDCSSVIDIEYTALRMMIEGEERLRREGITLWLAALNPEALRIVNNSSLGQLLGRERMFFNVQLAVAKYEQAGEGKHMKSTTVKKRKSPKSGSAEQGGPLDRKLYDKKLRELHGELVELQEWVLHKGLKVCIVFEGRDGAGKGGTIKAITERVSPRVFRVVALPAPSDREKSQMYMQRYIPHLPAAGEVVIFDRSWYNRAGVERVMGFCTEEQCRKFLGGVPLIEKAMVDSGIILLKYWLEVSPDEQTSRLESRILDRRKIWKLSPMDLKSYSRWYDYSRARDEMFLATDTAFAPWYVARSDDKKRARLNIITHLLSKIPHKAVARDKVKLPKRQKAGRYRPAKVKFKVIEERF